MLLLYRYTHVRLGVVCGRSSVCFSSSLATATMSRKQKIFELCDKVHRDLKMAGLPTDGCATDGTEHSSIAAMWSSELGYGHTAVGLSLCVFVCVCRSSCVCYGTLAESSSIYVQQ